MLHKLLNTESSDLDIKGLVSNVSELFFKRYFVWSQTYIRLNGQNKWWINVLVKTPEQLHSSSLFFNYFEKHDSFFCHACETKGIVAKK